MNGLESQLDRVVPMLLVLFRMSGLFLAVPLLSSISVPFQAKALGALIATAAIFPSVEAFAPSAPETFTLLGLVPMVTAELAIGFVLGVLASLPIIAMQAGGHIMGFQMGLSIASVYNPELDAQSDLVGELMYIVGVGLFALVGGFDVLLLAIFGSFERVPLGTLGVLGIGAPLEVYLGVLTSGFELALRVSAPVTATSMLLLLAMGFVMKTMPQINILTVGFAMKIMVGLAAIIAGLLIISDAGHEHTVEAFDALLGWVESLSIPAGGTRGL